MDTRALYKQDYEAQMTGRSSSVAEEKAPRATAGYGSGDRILEPEHSPNAPGTLLVHGRDPSDAPTQGSCTCQAPESDHECLGIDDQGSKDLPRG
jgi:hypothetical protein